LQLALEGANEGLWDWNIPGNATYYSDGWAKMLGFDPSEIGNSVEIFDRLIHGEDRAEAMKLLEDHLSGKSECYRAEFRMREKSGSWRWIQSRGRIVGRGADGAPVRVAGTHIDITSQRELLAELGRARDAALEASRAKSMFLANMSHEIRTPMNGIIGIAELLAGKELDDESQEFVNVIRTSGDALLQIVNNILDFSRIEAGQMLLESEPFSPRVVIGQVVDLLALSAQHKKIELGFEVDSNVPSQVVGDAGKLRQILVNLAGNAIKFTEEGGVFLHCRMVPSASARQRLEVEVRDTGPGMEAASVERLFQPFTQADESTTRRFGGTGLGLAISKQLVGLMHGTMTVETKLGEGSTFRVAVEFKADTGTAETRVTTSGIVPLAPASILLAEDNLVNQRVLSSMLARLGHSVRIVSNGRQAVQAVTGDAYDAVLLDCHMPEMNGYDAAREIRQRLAGSRVPIIAITASALVQDRAECMAAGMDDFISKPVDLATLSRTLHKWVHHGVEETSAR